MKEDVVQQHCVQWHNLQGKGTMLFSVANERKSNPQHMQKLKRMGLVSGVSDLILLLPSGKAVFIELKRPDKDLFGNKQVKGKQSQSQKDFESAVVELGFRYELIYSLDEFVELYKDLVN